MAVAYEESSFKGMFLLAPLSVSRRFFFYAWNILLCFETPRMTDWEGLGMRLSQTLYCMEGKTLVPGTWSSSCSWWFSGS